MTISPQQLAAFTPFNSLAIEYLGKVLEKASVRACAKGTIIVKRGRPSAEVYYLLAGCVDLIDSEFQVTSLDTQLAIPSAPLNSAQLARVSVVAKSDVQLLVLDGDFLDLVMAWSQSDDDTAEVPEESSDWMSALLQAPLFQRLPPANISQLFVRFETRSVKRDQVIVRQGERGDFFYVLAAGEAQVQDSHGQPLASLSPGAYFGEEALVGDTTRNASVAMSSDGLLKCLQKSDFLALLQEPVLRLIHAEDLASLSTYQFLDVRLSVERRFGSLANSRHIPLNQLRAQLNQLPDTGVYVVGDDAGRRAYVAVQLLTQAGFDACILQGAAQRYAP